jgi:2-amino-4-hydroxy-6-hydroxymethyldihydropteridine diphosphokinase
MNVDDSTSTHEVFIALGSNLGDRLSNLQDAIQHMPPMVRPLECSPIYETPPWGFTDQPLFLNQVIRANTVLNPFDLLAYLKQIEIQLGRQPTFRNGPRLIDLDILFYEDLILETKTLTIPHPRLAERGFVLVPLKDLAPHLRHPITGLTVLEMLAQVDTSGILPVSLVECDKWMKNVGSKPPSD